MSTKKVTQLTADTTPVGEDLAMIVSNVSVTPASRKIKLLNLLKSIFLADTTQLTFSTVADGEFLKRSGTNITSSTVAPSDAKYLVQTASSGLSAEQAMGALATGIVKNTTATGVQSIAAAGTDYVAPGSITTSGLTQNTNMLLGRGTASSGAIEEITLGTGVSLTGTTLNASGTGAPADATYITQTANGGLSAEQAMGSLATGLVKNTTTTGVQSIATAADISSPLYGVDVVGTDAYAVNPTPAVAALTDGLIITFKANVANTGGATLAVSGLTAKDIVKSAGGLSTALATNDIRAGQIVVVQFSSVADNFQMQSTLGNAASGGTPGGADTQVQYNSTGSFAGSANMVWDNSNALLKVNGAFTPTSNTGSNLGTAALRFNIAWVNELDSDSLIRIRTGWQLTEAGANGTTSSILKMASSSGVGMTWGSPPLTPAQITTDKNDYDPGNQAYFVRLSSDASHNITGFSPATFINGEVHLWVNVGSQNIVLKHQDAGSTAQNQFFCSTGADITLGANQAADIIRDDTTNRWRVFKRN